MEQGERIHKLSVRMSDAELDSVRERMKNVGIASQSVYLRKMAMDGYILKMDLPEIKEMIKLLRSSSNNMNQIAKKANAMGTVFEDDLKEIKSVQDDIWKAMNKILKRLGQLQ